MSRASAMLVLALLGCGDATAPRASLQELEQQRAKWVQNRPANYDYTYGFSGFPGTKTVRIQVRGGTVTNVVRVPSGEAGTLREGLTIDSVFARQKELMQSLFIPEIPRDWSLSFH